jgi:hypothetical protein
MVGWLVNNEVEGNGKEAVVSYFKVVLLYVPEGTEEDCGV